MKMNTNADNNPSQNTIDPVGPKTELQSFQEYATEQMEDWRFFMFIASWLFLMAFNYKNAHWVR